MMCKERFFTPEALPQREIAQISILRLNKKSAPTPIEQKGRFEEKKVRGRLCTLKTTTCFLYREN